MFFFLKILNETRGRRYLKADGNSGIRYLFQWDGKLRAYIYHPKSQEEVDDLFGTMGRATAYIFAPVNLPMTAAAAGDAKFTLEEAAALLAKQLELKTETTTGTQAPAGPENKLVEQCLHRGIIVTDDDTDETATRLISAFDKGAAAALNSLPKRKARANQKTTPSSLQ